MSKSRLFVVVASLAIVAFALCGQQAMAEEHHHWGVKVVPSHRTADVSTHPETLPANGLYGVGQSFNQTLYGIVANSDGSDIWPCFGNGQTGTAANPDCATIGDPAIANFSIAVGSPAYVWPLSNGTVYGNGFGCNEFTNGSSSTGAYNACGQTNTWYEDDSNDTSATDELIYEIYATQGSTTNFIMDSGWVDFGPNTYGGLTPGADVIIYGDQNFGYAPGEATGPNNGNCSADYNYPLTSNTYPGLYIVQAGKTCANPVAGAVALTSITEIGAPKYAKKLGTPCTSEGVNSPCYTTTWTKKFSVTQKWTIWIE